MHLSRKVRFLTILLVLLIAMTGCQQMFPRPDSGETTLVTEGETTPVMPTETQVQQLPAYTRQLSALQCYYDGVLQREYTITYDEQGRISVLKIYTYDNGNLYSWGENHYEYDDRGNLTGNDYVYSLGTQRWEYENEYDEQGLLVGYLETEYYNDKLVSQHREDCFYDDLNRYLGNVMPEEVTFDEYGRVLTIQVRVERGDYLADMDIACDYSCAPVMLCHSHTVFPEYEQFSSELRLMLNRYHAAFSLDMKDGYETVTDSQGYLTRVAGENGSDVYLFIYN